MLNVSTQILNHFRTSYGKDIDLTLRPAFHDLLGKFDNPHLRLPPVFHVAGTNGKGSTCAFLRAFLEAAGYRVHVYTSPHLMSFHERIRIAGELISEGELVSILRECERLAIPCGVSYFEVATTAAFVAFTRHKADFTILETGLGGRLDATNVVPRPLATLITRLSLDHREYLGDSLDKIAQEKAGIMRPSVPCFSASQPDILAEETLRRRAKASKSPLFVGKTDWDVTETSKGFEFKDKTRSYALPRPALLGTHQLQNAGLAIAALAALPAPLAQSAIERGLQTVDWPARLQQLGNGELIKLAPNSYELWLDGGHNDSAGEVLAAQIGRWRLEDGADPRPLHVILGMLRTKQPMEFLAPFIKELSQISVVPIADEPLSFDPRDLAEIIKRETSTSVLEYTDIRSALRAQRPSIKPARVLICGSLYLAGIALKLDRNKYLKDNLDVRH